MKPNILLPVFMLLAATGLAQERLTPIPISIVTKEAIEKDGRFSVNLTGVIPFGEGGKNYSSGFGLSARYHLRSELTKVYTDMPSADMIKRIEIIKDGADLIYGANALSSVVNLITKKEPATDQQFYYLQEKPFNVHVGLGGEYLFGKKETQGMYSYKYDPLTLVFASVGVTYRPCTSGDIAFDAGPATAIFKGGSNEWGYRLALTGSVDLNKPLKYYGEFWGEKKPGISAGIIAGISYNKFKEVDPILTGSLGIRFTF